MASVSEVLETMLHNIANEQVRLGHEIHIVVINDIVNDELKNTFDPTIHFSLFYEEGWKQESFLHIFFKYFVV